MKLKSTTLSSLTLALILCCGWFEFSYAHISDKKDISLLEAIEKISKEYEVYFTFDMTLVTDVRVEYEHASYQSAEEAIASILRGTELKYKFYDHRFVILYKENAEGLESLRKMSHHLDGLISEGEKSFNTVPKAEVRLVSMLTKPTYSSMIKPIAFSVEGTVVDQDGEPLIGVNIQVKGSNQGTTTDFEGRFTLDDIDENAVLVVSYIGYQTQEISVTGKSVLAITLISDSQLLDEVVVVGYGTKRKGDITSAVSVIDVENIGELPASNASRLLQGQAAGVVVKQQTGTPGEQMNIIIRGVGSLGAGSAPLYVVDGFALGTVENLNPNDIESITILKDAASTAIYGARGSNGVVLIETKNAKQGVSELTFTSYYGIQNLPASRQIQMMDGPQFARFLQESWMDRIRYFQNREPSLDEVPEGIRYPEQTQYSTNWLDEISHQNAPFQNYNLTLASGQGKIRSLVSAGYLSQDGALIETNFKRYNLRANVIGEFNDFISLGINLNGSYSGGKFAATTGRDAIVGKALWADPRDPVYNEDGSFNAYIGGKDGVFGTANPVMELHQHGRERFATNVTANGFVEITFLKDFKFRSSFSSNLGSAQRKDFRPTTLAGGGFNNPPPQPAQLWEWHEKGVILAADQILSYSRTFNNHHVDGMVGYSAQEDTWKQIHGYGLEFPNNEIRFLQQAENISTSSTEESWSLLAYIARANYSFANKYLFSASFRREGSSRFGKNNQFGNFPAVSVGWRISEEQFMPEVSWINDLKIRGSYGITGNNSIGNYNNSASLGSTGYILGNQYAPGVTLSSFVNRNIGWEESNQLDIGLDLSAFNNKLTFTAEYYEKTTNNMLLPVSIPSITGFTSTFTNIGKVQNNGVEFALLYRTRVARDLNLRTDFNISFNRNEVIEIDGENDELWSGSFYGVYNRSVVGRPIGMITGYKVLGLFQSDEEIANSPTQDGAVPGSMKMWDADGNGEISYDTKDMVEIGNPHPAFTWGFTLGVDYKQFDLNVLFTGAQDYDIMREIEKTTLNMDGVFNVLERAEQRFRSTEMPGDGRSPTANFWKWERESSSFYVFDASHAWIKSLTFGYTLKPRVRFLKEARLYFNADNLLLISDYPGSNPDINTSGDNRSQGRDDEAYPVPRTLSVGLNIKF